MVDPPGVPAADVRDQERACIIRFECEGGSDLTVVGFEFRENVFLLGFV